MTYSFKDYIQAEVLNPNTDFCLLKVYKKIKNRRVENFLFWYRASYVLYRKNFPLAKKYPGLSIGKSANPPVAI